MTNEERDMLEAEIKSMGGEIPMELLSVGSKIFVSAIGEQKGEKWIGFVSPIEATILDVQIHFPNYTIFNPTQNGFGGSKVLIETDKGVTFNLEIKKETINTDNDIIKSTAVYNGYNFIDMDFNRMKLRVTKELIRIVTGTWGGVNNVKAYDALKQVLRDDKTNFFSEQYPELVI